MWISKIKRAFNLSVRECGFCVHPGKGWLGASPDSVVHDPTATDTQGILEIICPYTIRNCIIAEACEDTTFYYFWDGTGMKP